MPTWTWSVRRSGSGSGIVSVRRSAKTSRSVSWSEMMNGLGSWTCCVIWRGRCRRNAIVRMAS